MSSKTLLLNTKKLVMSISRSTLSLSGGIRRAEFQSPSSLCMIGFPENPCIFYIMNPSPPPRGSILTWTPISVIIETELRRKVLHCTALDSSVCVCFRAGVTFSFLISAFGLFGLLWSWSWYPKNSLQPRKIKSSKIENDIRQARYEVPKVLKSLGLDLIVMR